MPFADAPSGSGAFGRLQAFARKPPAERCDLCGKELAVRHDHLMETAVRRLVCACDACAVLFGGHSSARFVRVPARVHLLADFQLTDAQWDDLRLPINLAFFYRNTAQGRIVAAYPSPAGATESLLELEAWEDIVAANPVLNQMQADVEALLVNRVGHARGLTDPEYFLAPADQCYRLVGLIRTGWKGLSGGNEVWRDIARFFSDLRAEATPVRGTAHA